MPSRGVIKYEVHPDRSVHLEIRGRNINIVKRKLKYHTPAHKKVPNENTMLTVWRTLRKLGLEKRPSGKLYM